MQRPQSVGLRLRLRALTVNRRLLAVGLVALAGLTGLGAARPLTTLAAPLAEQPTLTINPTCGAIPIDDFGQVSVTVHGSGFSQGQSVVLYSNGSPIQGVQSPLPVQSNGTFDASLILLIKQNEPDVSAYYAGATPDIGGPLVAEVAVQIPCQPTLTVTPDCGDPGVPLPIQIVASGFEINMPITVTVQDGSSNPPTAQQTPTDSNPVTFALTVTLPGPGYWEVNAIQAPPQPTGPILLEGLSNSARAYLVVPCSQFVATPICINSSQAPFPLALSGTNFQPSLNVNVVFDPTGQPQYFEPILAGADGSWSAEIDPYARPPGTYDITATQNNDGEIHVTHVLTMLTILDPSMPCPTGVMTATPNCAGPLLTGGAPRAYDVSVHGASFQPSAVITLAFDPEDLAGPSFVPEQVNVQIATDGTFDARFPNGVQARPVNNYKIVALDQTGVEVGELVFPMPCKQPSPRITAVNPNCGQDVGTLPPASTYQIEILGRGFIPGPAQVLFDTEQPVGTTIGPDGRLDAHITPPARPPGTYKGSVEQSDALHSLYQIGFELTVPCPTTTTPTLTITPGSASPGFVVTVHGDGFQPGATVDLLWSSGIDSARPIEIVAGIDGTFDRQVLIFAHDFEGPREMTAGTPTNPAAFPDATATLLVATGPGLPPTLNVFGGSPSDQPPIILRR